MRGNADAGVRKSTQEKVTKLQSAIDEILAKAAQQKTEQELTARNATDSWYQQALQNLDTSARSSASTEYAAEQEAAAKIQAAQLEAAAKAQAAALEAAKDNSAARGKYAQALMTNDNTAYGADDAWAEAYARYPGSDEQQNAYYTAYSNAKSKGYSSAAAAVAAKAAAAGQDPDDALQAYTINRAGSVVGNKDLLAGSMSYWLTAALFKGDKDNAKYTVEKLQPVVEKMNGYDQLSDEEKTIALAIASGNVIRSRWGTKSADFKQILAAGLKDKFSGVALAAALSAAGIKA